MIKSFRSKPLAELYAKSKTGKIDAKMHKRILARLDALNAAKNPGDLNLPGFDFHPLKGQDRFTVHVNGPWCVTFAFKAGDAFDVDFEQYH